MTCKCIAKWLLLLEINKDTRNEEKQHEKEISNKSHRLIVFDDWWSLLHFLLGIATRILAHASLWYIAIAIFTAFVVYEWREQESRFCKLGDFVEYAYGYILGNILTNI